MKIAHSADWHLGFRAYERTNAVGANQREHDVAEAVRRCITAMIAARPDLVLIGGDVFHSVRPTNKAILVAFAELQRLRAGLPETPVIVVSGNHDSPRTSDAVAILGLYRALGVTIVHERIERVALPGGTVTCVPSNFARRLQDARPDPDAALNVLLLHGVAPKVAHGTADIDEAQLDGFDYVALGDYHVARQVGPRAWYSGSLCYVSSNPWGELQEQTERGVCGKGWLQVEVEPGVEPRVTFRAIDPPRRYVDLEPIDATSLSAEAINAAVAERMRGVAIDGVVCRLVVHEVAKDARPHLDFAQLREWRRRALHFELRLERCEEEVSVVARGRRVQSLFDQVTAALTGRRLPEGIDRAAFVAQGQQYFQEAETSGAEAKR